MKQLLKDLFWPDKDMWTGLFLVLWIAGICVGIMLIHSQPLIGMLIVVFLVAIVLFRLVS